MDQWRSKFSESDSSRGSQAKGHCPRKTSENPTDPRRTPQSTAEPSERPRRALGETLAEPFERQISSESLAEGCAPRMVTLWNFKPESFCLDRYWSIELQSWRPSKEVPKPRTGKVLCRGSIGDRTQSTFLGTFLGTPFRTGTFRSTFFGTFLVRGLCTSSDGRQDCNHRVQFHVRGPKD